MAFPISKVAGAPRFDALPVAKIIHYPLEKRDYKPFAQNRICVGSDGLYLRMWAFEVSPMPTSELRCVLCPYPSRPGQALCVSVLAPEREGAGNRAVLCLLQDGLEVAQSRRDLRDCATSYNGEDLQGVYWGETVALPFALLEELGGEPPALRAGDRFLGNFYKLCDDSRFYHRGCYYPADFTGNPYENTSLGTFEVVAY